MRLTVHLVICTSQFLVHFDSPTFRCLFLLDPPIVRHMHKRVTSLDFMELSKGSWRRSTQCGPKKTSWARTKKRGRYPNCLVERLQTGLCVLFAAITDDAIREACRTAYFPSGLKLTRLEDMEFFRKHNPKSDYDDGSQTNTDDSGDSDDSSGVSDSDTDEDCDMIWAKAGCGVWGLCHVFEDTLYLTRDLTVDSAVPSNLSIQM